MSVLIALEEKNKFPQILNTCGAICVQQYLQKNTVDNILRDWAEALTVKRICSSSFLSFVISCGFIGPISLFGFFMYPRFAILFLYGHSIMGLDSAHTNYGMFTLLFLNKMDKICLSAVILAIWIDYVSKLIYRDKSKTYICMCRVYVCAFEFISIRIAVPLCIILYD